MSDQPSTTTTTTTSTSSCTSCVRLPSPGRTLKQDPTGAGCLHLGSDGVLRSYSGDGAVLDHRQLSPAQIAEHVAVFRATGVYDAEQMAQIEAGYRGADGRDVPLERCVEPGDEQRPVHLRGKQKKAGEE
ncbi:uncharacterized protein LTHEOB_2017 [Lasiodiplodia theobromae]|uniref:uncharacterized protein n=1 Tax=Lasiodiplodia theobromae TaxID=45133 RepID=UPI0015C31D6A|nr:uncharacterized protein LTHEOB_2017 [Lasiodiplodia theobromae]KAF4536256.1 hypothetical protein LTHEOB_2017 [Lasiodiplodia theobromae]